MLIFIKIIKIKSISYNKRIYMLIVMYIIFSCKRNIFF